MARQIVITEDLTPNDPGSINYRVAYWLTPPASQQVFYANASAKSSVKDANASELAALTGGQVVEVSDSFRAPAGTAIGAIEAAMASRFTELQSQLTASTRFRRAGTSFDGTTWTLTNNT